MKVRTLKTHTYAGIERYPGDEYDMEEPERFYAAMAHVGNVIEAFEGVILTRELEADPPKKYRTRDMARDLRAK